MTQRVHGAEQESCLEATAPDRQDRVGSPQPVILGIETSCDETAAAVVAGDGRILSSIV